MHFPARWDNDGDIMIFFRLSFIFLLQIRGARFLHDMIESATREEARTNLKWSRLDAAFLQRN
jgi:hypothetical protein